nr:hypothetical protein [Myxococcota bacterium]
ASAADARAPDGERGAGIVLELRAAPTLHGVARNLEAQLYARLFAETKGDFDAMAARLLEGDDAGAGRRVRLRFNQLGLRARSTPARSPGRRKS